MEPLSATAILAVLGITILKTVIVVALYKWYRRAERAGNVTSKENAFEWILVICTMWIIGNLVRHLIQVPPAETLVTSPLPAFAVVLVAAVPTWKFIADWRRRGRKKALQAAETVETGSK